MKYVSIPKVIGTLRINCIPRRYHAVLELDGQGKASARHFERRRDANEYGLRLALRYQRLLDADRAEKL